MADTAPMTAGHLASRRAGDRSIADRGAVLDAASGGRAATPGALFGSMFLAGFECSNHLTPEGVRMDLISATQHDRLAAEDYERCRNVGIRAVREAARWPIADEGQRPDVREIRRLARLGRQHGVLQIWDLVHYGFPSDLDSERESFGEAFVQRIADFAAAVARVVVEETEGPTWWTPVNEISYTAWAAGEVGIIAPGWRGRGWEYKVILVRAAIAAFDAIRSIDPEARTLSAEPLVRLHVHPDVPIGPERDELQGQADDFNERIVSEAYDMLAGRVAPELGGSREHLGVVGVNYYEGNQWTIGTPELPQHFLGRDDPAWAPLHELLRQLSVRYGGPIVVSETGSSGQARRSWLGHLVDEAVAALDAGVDLQGICLYPIVTSPDWNDPTAFFEGGLWDVQPRPDGTLERVLAEDLLSALSEGQARLEGAPALWPAPSPALSAVTSPVLGPPAEIPFANLADAARYSPDGFVCVPLFAGDELVADLYCLEPGKSVAAHRHDGTDHVLTVIQGSADIRVGDTWLTLRAGESVLAPRGLYHGIHNATTERVAVQQVSSPKPWDARFGGPRPSDVRSVPPSSNGGGEGPGTQDGKPNATNRDKG